MRRLTRQWAWRTQRVSNGTTGARTGSKRRKANASERSALNPQLAEGHTCLGNVFFSAGRYEEAVQQFQRSLDLDHNSDETLRLLAAAYEKQGKLGMQNRPTARLYRCVLIIGMSTMRSALFITIRRATRTRCAMFQKAITLAPSNFRAYSNLGGIYLLLGRYKDAVDALKQSNTLRPSFESYGNLGAAYFYMRRYQDSVDNLQQALKIDDKDWLNWGNLGDTLYQIPTRRADSLAAYQKAIELARARIEVNPKDSFALAFTADYYAMLDQRLASARTDHESSGHCTGGCRCPIPRGYPVQPFRGQGENPRISEQVGGLGVFADSDSRHSRLRPSQRRAAASARSFPRANSGNDMDAGIRASLSAILDEIVGVTTVRRVAFPQGVAPEISGYVLPLPGGIVEEEKGVCPLKWME